VIYLSFGIRRKRVREGEEKEEIEEKRTGKSTPKRTWRYIPKFVSLTRNIPGSSRIQPQDNLGG